MSRLRLTPGEQQIADTFDIVLADLESAMTRIGADRMSALTAGGSLIAQMQHAQAVASATDRVDEPPSAGWQRHSRRIHREWWLSGRAEQKPPEGAWRTWLIMGGRGSGKTRAGAEWVHALATESARSDLRIALVAETLGDAREVMVDGVSGICRIARKSPPEFEVSRRRLVWPSGAVAQIFSSEDPEALRGPQFHYAWCDELAKWKHAQETFDMLQFGLRLGDDPRQLVTTTPRPVPVLKRLIADPETHLVRISTTANAGNWRRVSWRLWNVVMAAADWEGRSWRAS